MTRKNFIIVLGLILFLSPTPVLAERYLTIPMFNYNLVSFFDHDKPNFIENDNFIRYDGQQWTDGSASINYPCTLGVNCYDGHNGVDLSAPVGADVIASAPGTITTYIDDCGGKTSRVYHPEEGYSTLYAHLDSFIITSGSVDRFEHIAESGNSGNCTTGPHLHFGVREGQTGGRRADPYGWNPEPDSPVQNDPCEGYSSDLCVDLGYLWTTDPPSLEPPGGDDPLPVINVSGNITEDTTWKAGYVYLIQGSVTVVENVTLTLEPGVIVKFQNTSSRFNIYGNLYAQGTQQNKIHFTSYKDDTVGGDSNGDGNTTNPDLEDWRGIYVYGSGIFDSSHGVIRYGGYRDIYSSCGSSYCGAIKVNGGRLVIDSGTISNNNYGIYFSNTTIPATISNTNIINNDGGIYFSNTSGTSTVSIFNSLIDNNNSFGVSVLSHNVNLSISQTTISNHSSKGVNVTSPNTGGLKSFNITITDTDFVNNQTHDAYIYACSYYGIAELNFINFSNTTSGTGGNGFYICGGKLSSDQIWNPGVPYVLGFGGFSVPLGTTLTINPGVVVKFHGIGTGYNSAYLSISGILNALGTPQNKIYFTSYRDDTIGGDSNGDGNATLPAPEDYVGITVGNTGIVNISNAVLRYGGRCQGQYACQTRGVINGLSSGASVTVDSSTINDNDYGIYFYNTSGTSTISVSNSLIDNNGSLGIRTGSPNVSLSINQTTISNHSYDGIYIYNNSSGFKSYDISITNSQFINNKEDGYFSYYSVGGGEINFVNSGNTTSGTGGNGFHISGSLKDNQVWNPGVPFVIGPALNVPAGSSLTINPGVIVKFKNHWSYVLSVNGTLNALGTSQNRIYFTSYHDDAVGGDTNGNGNVTIPAPEDFIGITIGNIGTVNISNAVLRYGGRCQGQYSCQARGVITNTGGVLSVTDSLINKNNYGVYRNSGTTTITQSSIKENTSYGIYHTGTGTTTATSNWWGDASGPYHPQNNPNGQGDRVSNNVEFSSWLIEDPFWKKFIFPKK